MLVLGGLLASGPSPARIFFVVMGVVIFAVWLLSSYRRLLVSVTPCRFGHAMSAIDGATSVPYGRGDGGRRGGMHYVVRAEADGAGSSIAGGMPISSMREPERPVISRVPLWNVT